MTTKLAFRLAGVVAAAPLLVMSGCGRGSDSVQTGRAEDVARPALTATSPSAPSTADIAYGAQGPTFNSSAGRLVLRAATAARGATTREAGAVTRRVAHGAASYRSDNVTTEYRKTAVGIQQRVTIARRPSGVGGSVTVRLQASGALTGRSHGGRALFAAPGGGGIRLGEATARDSTGKELPAKLAVDRQGLAYRISDGDAQYPVTIDPLIQDGATLIPDDADADQGFSWTSALSEDGSTAIVGSPGTRRLAGAAWIFKKIDGIWIESARLEPSDETGPGKFGASVAISADGNTVLIGAPDNLGLYRPHHGPAGAAWVFAFADGSWTQQGAKLAPTDGAGAAVGTSVALAADGDTALLAGHGTWVYVRKGGAWTQAARLTRADAPSDASHLTDYVAISGAGTSAVVGQPDNANGEGGAWFFAGEGSSWQQSAAIGAPGTGSDGRFGDQVAISSDGARALIGGGGAAWSASRNAGSWALAKTPLKPRDANPSGAFATKIDLSADGKTALIAGGQDATRGAWVFRGSAAGWEQSGTRIPGLSNNAGIDGVAIGEGSRQLLVDGRTVDAQGAGSAIGG